MDITVKDIFEWAVIPLAFWLIYTVHMLVVEVRAIRAELVAGREVHERHEKKLESLDTTVGEHGLQIARLREHTNLR